MPKNVKWNLNKKGPPQGRSGKLVCKHVFALDECGTKVTFCLEKGPIASQ